MSEGAPWIVGIDLGTTNSAIACCRPGEPDSLATFPIPQLILEGEVAPRNSLPSAIYLAGEHDVPAGALALPWAPDARQVVGGLARLLGARVAGRVITSAKSWLCHGGVDRAAAILPWGTDAELQRLSPVEATARLLAHIRAAWDDAHPEARLAEQDVILTVPASFDEVARELTVQAARAAGLEHLRLLEEPQAALYAWTAAHPDWRERLAGSATILVIDVGGGTTDFSLVAVREDSQGRGLERTFVGEHLLVGGDNMDLALARQLSESAGARLDAARWQQLTALCRAAKERLLSADAPDATVEISLAGRGRSVVQGALRGTLEREAITRELLEDFFPVVGREEGPKLGRGSGLQEFGLPFAEDAAVTRHLAAFLQRAEASLGEPVVPDTILFNGGALQPAPVRERLLAVLGDWFGKRPEVLAGADLDLAVSRGAAAYGQALRGTGERISGGAPRAFYLGIGAAGAEQMLCLTARGMEEGEEVRIADPELELLANTQVAFPLFVSTTRLGDPAGALVEFAADSVTSLPPLGTVLRFGRSLDERIVPVRLRSVLTETGTLEVFCESVHTEHRWKLSFDLRAQASADAWESDQGAAEDSAGLLLPDAALDAATAALENVFLGDGDSLRLGRRLEEALGLGRDGWPLTALRTLWDRVFAWEESRARSPEHEARWLNLVGFFLRPGYGDPRDSFRGERLWRLHDAGPRHPRAAQVRAEWWTLWKRAAGSLSRPQQTALLQDIRPSLLPAARRRRTGGAKPTPQELREMWQVAGSLERLAQGLRGEIFLALAKTVAKGREKGDAEIWALGRLGARVPVYGPADTVLSPALVSPIVRELSAGKWRRPAATALAVAQMARRSGDRARDLSDAMRDEVATRLDEAEEGRGLATLVREVGEPDAQIGARIVADSLPSGLRIAAATPDAVTPAESVSAPEPGPADTREKL
ncbi:MAG: Hsp70 family protein [Deltaproteobacteria bacterium]